MKIFWNIIPYRPMLEMKESWKADMRVKHGTADELHAKLSEWIEFSMPYSPLAKEHKGKDYLWFKSDKHAAVFKLKWL
jgi:hypothetical protein